MYDPQAFIATTITLQSITIFAVSLIIIKLKQMSTENKDKFEALLTRFTTGIQNVRGDIQRIKDSVDPTGGLTEEEAKDLLNQFGGVADSLDALDKENEPADTTENGQTPS